MLIRGVSPDKTEVPGSRPGWPTKSSVPEELPIRELLMMLLGEEGKRKLENKTKTNDQLLIEVTITYLNELSGKECKTIRYYKT